MCIFCKIIAGDIPVHQKIYEDAKVIAFLDIKPVNPGHILVLAKTHYPTLEVAPEADYIALMLAVKKMGALLKDKLGAAGYNIEINNDPVAGQIIPHLHVHVIPRHAGDGHVNWPQSEYEPGEAEAIAKKLTS
jgi:histidine triad (HIT) family protein